jgi:hypothetical protein
VAFGTLTLMFHDELLRGDRVALGLAGFIGVFWLMRVVMDFTVHTHADWPQCRAQSGLSSFSIRFEQVYEYVHQV